MRAFVHSKYFYFLLFCGLVLLYTSYFVPTWYSNNDGVTLACAAEPLWKIFHPGLQSVWGCTYDHQPLYFVFVKIITAIWGHQLIYFQIFNALCLSLGLVIIMRELRHHTSLPFALILPVLFTSSWFILGHVQEIRMYSFYLMTCLFLQAQLLKWERNQLPDKKSGFIHLLGYLNFFLYLIPLCAYLGLIWSRLNRRSPHFKMIALLSVCLVLIKLPFMIWWRVYMRSGETHFKQHGLIESFELLFNGPTSFTYLTLLLFVCGLGFQLTQWKKSPLAKFNLFLIVFTAIFILVTKNIFRMHEVDFRYFLYLVPVLITSSAVLLQKLKKPMMIAILSLVLIYPIYSSHRSMFTYVNPESQNQAAVEFYTELTSRGRRTFWTEDKHFLQNYLGIFGQLKNGIRPRFLEFRHLRDDPSPLDPQHVIVTLISSLEEHQKHLLSQRFCYQTKAFEQNFFGHQTIFSVTIDCPSNDISNP